MRVGRMGEKSEIISKEKEEEEFWRRRVKEECRKSKETRTGVTERE